MFSPGNRLLLGVAGVVAVTITVVILLNEEKPVKREKRQMKYYSPSASVIQKNGLDNPCSTTDKDKKTTPEVYFCYQSDRTISILTFNQHTYMGGYALPDWASYDWYIDSSGIKQSGYNWEDVVATTGSWDSSTYGYSETAKAWKEQLTMIKTQNSITIKVNTTMIPFGTPHSYGELAYPPCHGFMMCVYRPYAADPCGSFSLCPNVTLSEGDVHIHIQMPELTPGPKSSSTAIP